MVSPFYRPPLIMVNDLPKRWLLRKGKRLGETRHFKGPFPAIAKDRLEKKESYSYGKTNSKEIETKDAQGGGSYSSKFQ